MLLTITLLAAETTGLRAQQLFRPGLNQRIDPALEQQVQSTLRKSSRSLQLVVNNGQQGLSKDIIAYFTSGYETVFIEKDRMRVVVTEAIPDRGNKKVTRSRTEAGSHRYRSNSFTIRFQGAAMIAAAITKDPFAVKRNFITAQKGNIRSVSANAYSEITLKNIYRGIDLRLYSREDGHLEFDWVVWPGADISRIRMQFSGQQRLSLVADGGLQVHLPLGNFYLHLPESYYVTPAGKSPAPIRFRVGAGRNVSFSGLAASTSKYPLVIDPDLLWGTFFDGGNSVFDEYLYGIEYNTYNDKLYCAGAASLQVTTIYAAALSAGYDSTFAATPDVLVYALSKNGQFVTNITYLGGLDADVGTGVAITPSFIYVSGYTSSADFPVTKLADGHYPAFDSVYHGNTDGFVAVFSPSLDSLHYCSYLGGDGTDKALTIRARQDSTFYISLSSTDTLPASSPSYIAEEADSIFAGNSEAWIASFTSFHTLRFGSYIGGGGDDLVNDFQLLSTGDVVFTGTTRNITEVNGSVASGTGQDVLFGRLDVPASGPVSFRVLEKFGGNSSDHGWGILSLGDSVSILVGQTGSFNFPLGSGTIIQNTHAGQIDGFIARINNDGTSGYKATFIGGSDDDILVSVRPVVVNNVIALLSWGTTASNDLSVRNILGGSFYNTTNTGGLDMVFVITDVNFTSEWYLSYIGGSANDYLGATGAPIGANHLYYNPGDSVLYLGTTTHSNQTTHQPMFVGRGPADFINFGVPVFDQTKGNGNNDTHVIIALSMKGLYGILASNHTTLEAVCQPDCREKLTWETVVSSAVSCYTVERSPDGIHFTVIATSHAADKASCFYYDNNPVSTSPHVFYRIGVHAVGGAVSYSNVSAVKVCAGSGYNLKVYPTFIKNTITVSGLSGLTGKTIRIGLFDASGKKMMEVQRMVTRDDECFILPHRVAPGSYFMMVQEGNSILYHAVLVSGGRW